jgi:zinc transport system ATP-binding protein
MVAASLAKVGLRGQESQRISSLSGGQVQRLLLARALVHQPEVLILDEPEAGVDAAGEQSFYEVLTELVATEKMTVLIASHELELVRNYADEVLCLNRNLICYGKPDTVMTKETFQKLYGQGFGVFQHHAHHHEEQK